MNKSVVFIRTGPEEPCGGWAGSAEGAESWGLGRWVFVGEGVDRDRRGLAACYAAKYGAERPAVDKAFLDGSSEEEGNRGQRCEIGDVEGAGGRAVAVTASCVCVLCCL
jgi:hypothetical protein